ncbi:unnamed protein product [Heligmosomoides polygyrus]|uniref:Tyrosine-protein phosphatase domain-containing protein n=1 Tax=Heligmosomoides polygyrus TaxID=6339 RepID=A0A183FK43_HELPZ|nr:unnamed protein product [Heligmosomoides polygyrus]
MLVYCEPKCPEKPSDSHHELLNECASQQCCSHLLHNITSYYNIPCIDSTRVVLKSGPCDYIHANWVTMKDGRKFICTQGPLLNTMGDFWRMIVQEKCHMIVMLCRNIECKSLSLPICPCLQSEL